MTGFIAALGGLPFLPEGTTLPPVPYLVAVLLAGGGVAVAFRRRAPEVSAAHVLGLVPWIALGAAFHVLYVVGGLPRPLAPLGGSPTVYLATGTLAGGVWLGAEAVDGGDRTPRLLAAAGTSLLVPVVAVAVAGGVSGPGARWSAVAVVVAAPVAIGAWRALVRINPAVGVTGGVGGLVVFAHALDGVSTAVGVTQLGFGERSPLSRLLLELGGLPSVPVFGEGWVFLLVKLAVAGVAVSLFVPYVRETPREGMLFLGFLAAVGLGPAAHNLLLFTIAG
ncbi:MAG: putative membrane protein [uncultured archaeon A07HR67]|nr:MAG: putative membrane protein [uncultured archaeon A07HR67]